MGLFIVTYDLDQPNRNYSGLYERLKSYEAYCRPTESTWILATSRSAQQIYDYIRPAMDSGDYVFISNLGQDRQGWLQKDTWEWLRNHSHYAVN